MHVRKPKPQQRLNMTKKKKSTPVEKTQVGSSLDDLILSGDVMLDLGNYGAGCETLSSIAPLDTITISGSDSGTLDMSTITFPSSSSGIYTISNTGTYGGGGTTWSNTTGGYTFAGINTAPSTVNINTDGIDMAAGTDIKIDGKSLKEFMNKMEQRLSILVPDPEKLEKFEALKKAYEHYKTMEALCFPEKENQK